MLCVHLWYTPPDGYFLTGFRMRQELFTRIFLLLLGFGFMAQGCGDPAPPKTAVLVSIRFSPAQYDVDQFRLVGRVVIDAADTKEHLLPQRPGAVLTASPTTAVILVPDRWTDKLVHLAVLALRDGSIVANGSSFFLPQRGQIGNVEVVLEKGAPLCGNGILEAGEICDGTALAGQTCQTTTGLTEGHLACTSLCTLDLSGCFFCGNGAVEGPEECDGANLGGKVCKSFGFESGELTCNALCKLDTSNCMDGCGNGVVERGEQCDGEDFGGQSCLTAAGRHNGDLWCMPTCFLDISGCHTCGDGLMEGPEECDGFSFGGRTCQTEGFRGGALSCTDLCTLDTSGCNHGCGNGLLDPGEECDGEDFGGASCESLTGLPQGELGCLSDCRIDSGDCHLCGNGILEGSEACDGTVPAGVSCESLGHDGGLVACTQECSLDESLCHRCGNGLCESFAGEDAGLCPSDCGWVRLAAGGRHTCGLRGDGHLFCWGAGEHGQLGVGILPFAPEPLAVVDGAEVSSLAAGGQHTCAVSVTGRVQCAGRNHRGQLGTGSTIDEETLTPVPWPDGLVGVTAGTAHTCAWRWDGALFCWGDNTSGRLGDGTTSLKLSPTWVSSISGVVRASAGDAHTCAVTGSGQLYCWGAGGNGRIGDGSANNELLPVLVDGVSGAIEVAAGGAHTCAVLGTGGVACWGSNTVGQLGIGSVGSGTMVPVPVPGIDDAVTLDVGDMHGCVTLLSGEARCWGLGTTGELGTGVASSSSSPVAVASLGDLLGISAGVDGLEPGHGCAWNDQGEAFCWGAGTLGQLGDGLAQDSAAPRLVSSP